MHQERSGESSVPKVSIVVACKTIDHYVLECVRACQQLEYPDYELIVLPDFEEKTLKEEVTVIPTGTIKPSEKRNIGVKYSKGQIVAFIDGDAYPSPDWLRNAVKYFQDLGVGAVGGPGLTPETDKTTQKASGEILSSFIGAGPLSFRHNPTAPRKCDDLPSVNLIVRKPLFEEIGGFDSSFWPGEDTKFCRDLILKEKMDMLYAPDVQVYHHRRSLFRPHLKQIAGYGFHRGYFSRKFPENSRKLLYFMPFLLVTGLPIAAVLSYFNEIAKVITVLSMGLYLSLLSVNAIMTGFRHRNVTIAGMFFLGTIATHVCYGTYFARGLFSGRRHTLT